ncbi:Fe-S cluster assembly protein SufD [Rhizobiales bacterium GAS188]|nr:Fe-S cluster assembly protein SufD [Rhizobiales bacterium GAS188]
MTSLTPVRTKAETALMAQFEALRADLPSAGAAFAARDEAIAAFAAGGLPHRRVEAYHYTDLRNLLREAAPLAGKPKAKAGLEAGRLLGDLEAHEVLIVNGRLQKKQGARPLPAGVSLAIGADTTPAILDRADAVVALNTALTRESVTLKVEDGVEVAQPLHVIFVQDAGAPQAVYARLRLELGKGASVTLVETHEGPARIATQSNIGVEIAVADGARLAHVRVAAEGEAAFSLSSLGLSLGREASALSLNMALGSAVARHQILARFVGEEARLTLAGVSMLDGARHSDVTLVVDHAVPGGQSRELFKTVVEDRAAGVFQGKIIVRPHAQKTDGKMMSAALLLSEEASMSNKPELEIFADDVQCGHGATCGALDDNLLFYLMARGIPRRDAQALLIRSFLGEAVDEVTHEKLREGLGGLVDQWLLERGKGDSQQ